MKVQCTRCLLLRTVFVGLLSLRNKFNLCSKKNHRRERRIGDPRTQTPIRCQRMKHRSSQGYSAKNSKPIRTPKNEPRWFKPLENDWILIFFCFTRTTSWTRRLHPAYCSMIVYSDRFEPHTHVSFRPFRPDFWNSRNFRLITGNSQFCWDFCRIKTPIRRLISRAL